VTRTLVVQTAWLGDVLLTTPLLDALARRHGPVDVLVTPAAAPLVEIHPAVGAVLTYDKRGRDRGPAAFWRRVRALRARGYDTAVLAQGSFRSGLLVRAAGIPRRIGFADDPAARWCTERRLRPTAHQTERLLALADAPPAGGPWAAGAPGPAPVLALTAEDHAGAAAALAAAGVGGPFVALAPGSARPTKRWPHYRALAALLAPEIAVVVIGGPGDGFGPGAGGGGIADLTGLPLRVSAAVLARAVAAVVNDSASLHLAQAVRTPLVAIFGPTHPRLGFGPRGARDVTLGLALDCRPCSTHGGRRCPLGHHRCLQELTADTVRTAVHRVLATEEVPCVS
jgi:heptosyltransferase-2